MSSKNFIPQAFISELVSTIDIEEFLSGYITLKRAGGRFKALCPFHNEKSPSFTVYPETGSYFCFGCSKGGGALDFIMDYENLQFIDAVRFLANRQGMVIPNDDGNESEFSRQKAVVYEINKLTAKFFFKCLKSEYGKVGYDYLKSRGLDDGIIKVFALGYAPNSWDSLYKFLKSKGYKDDDLVASNVIGVSQKGNYYDIFRNRVIFPIMDLRGNFIGFGGRVLDDSKPKYLNTSDTPVFKKSQHLFALNLAKKQIDNDTLVLCEGYMDVVAMHASGFKNSVATLGTAITSEQARLISKYASKVVIAYDSDDAGKMATRRALNILDEVDISSTVLKIDGAKDPDEFIKKNGNIRFKMLLENSNNISEYEIDELKNKFDLSTNEGKIDFTKSAIYVLSKIKNKIEQDVYINNVAKLTGVVPNTIKQQVNAVVLKNNKENQKKQWQKISQNRDVYTKKGKELSATIIEENILAFLFRNNDVFGTTASKLKPEDFVTEFNSKIYTMMLHLDAQDLELNVNNLTSGLTREEGSAVARIIAQNDISSNSESELIEYIKLLNEEKSKIKFSDLDNVDILDIEKYRKEREQANKANKQS